MAAGRPLEDLTSLPENWYIEVLSLYEKGASDVEVKALIYSWRGSFSNDLWERWIKDYDEFSETIKTGKLLSEAWWHKEGRTNLKTKDFNYTGWYMNMKNRFGWVDKSNIDHTSKGESLKQTIIVSTEENKKLLEEFDAAD
jgi:hypothetical protein